MADPSADASGWSASLRHWAPRLVLGLGLAGCTSLALVQADFDRAGTTALGPVLGIAALVAGLATVPMLGRASASGAFIVATLAAALLGPAAACGCAVIAEVAATLKMRTPRMAMAFNLLGAMAPALAAGNLVHALHPTPTDSVAFYATVCAAGALDAVLNFGIVAVYQQWYRGNNALNLHVLIDYLPSLALNIALAVAGTSIYLQVGIGGIIFALVAVFAFSYMAYLLERARRRSEQYVSLSWGVLAGLMRSLHIRDERAARHAAAVARFSRDIAGAVGMSEAECELAHTAGLLHDIGTFALSDRVAERGRTLNDEDWVAIQRHPALGADMLKDLGMYGPVAEIVRSHHERIDGRGYPRGLAGEEIPEIAKIISVAEVYDTLTASDTYRTRVSSFEALRELRRVAGSQLDARYVEVLAELLSGEGVDYRHADAVDFDSELNMERRIREAGAG